MKSRTIKLVILGLMTLAIICIGILLFVNPVEKFSSISFSSFNYADSEKYTQASEGSVRGVENLEVVWVSGSVEIVPCDGDEVIFEEHSDNGIPDDERLCFWKDGSTLRIQFTSSGIHKTMNSRKNLLIHVPADLELGRIDVDVISAEVSLADLNAQRLRLDTTSGDISLASVNARKIEVDGISGNIVAEGVGFESFVGDMVSGDFSIGLVPVFRTQSIELDTISGDINLTIPEEIGFELDFDTVSGDLSCSLETRMLSRQHFIHGDGFAEFELETVSGDVTLM